jgi:hypothetical protein
MDRAPQSHNWSLTRKRKLLLGTVGLALMTSALISRYQQTVLVIETSEGKQQGVEYVQESQSADAHYRESQRVDWITERGFQEGGSLTGDILTFNDREYAIAVSCGDATFSTGCKYYAYDFQSDMATELYATQRHSFSSGDITPSPAHFWEQGSHSVSRNGKLLAIQYLHYESEPSWVYVVSGAHLELHSNYASQTEKNNLFDTSTTNAHILLATTSPHNFNNDSYKIEYDPKVSLDEATVIFFSERYIFDFSTGAFTKKSGSDI